MYAECLTPMRLCPHLMYAGCAGHQPQDAHPKGVIHLEHCNIRDGDAKTKKKHSIEVYHAERRVFYLQAESVSVLLPSAAAASPLLTASHSQEADKAAWMSVLQRSAELNPADVVRCLGHCMRVIVSPVIMICNLSAWNLLIYVDVNVHPQSKREQALKREIDRLVRKCAQLQNISEVSAGAVPDLVIGPVPHAHSTVFAQERRVTVQLTNLRRADADDALRKHADEVAALRVRYCLHR